MEKKPEDPGPQLISLRSKSSEAVPRERIGIPGLDNLLGGGVLRGSNILLLGGAGTGKTFFSLQFLLEAMNQGERSLYLYLGTASPLLARGLPFQDQLLAQEKQFRFQMVLQPMDEAIHEPLERFLGGLRGLDRTRVVIEVAKPCDQMSAAELEFVARLQRRFQEGGATTLLSNRFAPTAWNQLGPAQRLLPGADGILLLDFLNPEKDSRRSLAILGLWGVAQEKIQHELLMGDEGLRVNLPEALSSPKAKGGMLIAAPNFKDADEKKDYLLTLKKLLKGRLPSASLPEVHGRHQLFYDILTELNSPATDFGLMLVYDAIVPFLARQGLIQPMDKALPDHERRFLPASTRRGMVDGQLYSVPLHTSVRLLFYRKDLLEKHGFKPPKSWDELIETGLTILDKEKKPLSRVLAMQFPSYSQLSILLDHLWSAGQDLYAHPSHWEFNKNAVVVALKRLHRLVSDPRLASPSSLEATYWDPIKDFLDGKALFLHHWSDVLRLAQEKGADFARNIGYCPLPGNQSDGASVMLGGPSYVIPARTRFQKQAFELLAALYEPDTFIQLEQRCGWPFPGLREVYRDPKAMAKRPYYAEAEALLRNGRYIEDLPYIRGNYLNWENASSQILDPLFRKDPASARFEETAENLQLRLSVFLPKPVYSDLVAKAVESIHRNLSRSLSVQTLAKELGVSRSHLIRQFKKGTRMTPLRYLNQARVDKAKELLQYTTFNVSEVSVQVGFKSIFHFSKVFRQISGRNPSEFKQFRYQPR